MDRGRRQLNRRSSPPARHNREKQEERKPDCERAADSQAADVLDYTGECQLSFDPVADEKKSILAQARENSLIRTPARCSAGRHPLFDNSRRVSSDLFTSRDSIRWCY